MRTTEEIYQELLADYTARCGLAPEDSCEVSVRLYAAAAQVQALERQGEWVVAQSFPQTAQGVYLERHAAARGLERISAAKAVGTLRFTVSRAGAVDLKIPAGTVCMTEDEQRFQTTAAVVLAAGDLSVTAPARAVKGGSAGNVAGGTVTVMTACPVGVTACTNPTPFSGGSDPESDELLRTRVLESYRRLPNGANAAWYEQTALEHEGVVEAQAVGRARGVGTVDVYIATESGLPTAQLLSAVRADLQERREIAVDVQALSPTQRAVNVTLAVAPKAGQRFAAVKAGVEAALAAFFNGRLLGRPLRVAELTSLVFRLEGVDNVRLTAPAADIAAQQGQLPVLGTVSITELEA